jgi:hypothetical protein
MAQKTSVKGILIDSLNGIVHEVLVNTTNSLFLSQSINSLVDSVINKELSRCVFPNSTVCDTTVFVSQTPNVIGFYFLPFGNGKWYIEGNALLVGLNEFGKLEDTKYDIKTVESWVTFTLVKSYQNGQRQLVE